MAEKKTTKAAATKAAAEKAPAKKCATKKCAAKATIALTAEFVGFKAGDVYQALAATEGAAMTVAQIAKAAKISAEETLLGLGWLLKEGKVVAVEDKVALA